MTCFQIYLLIKNFVTTVYFQVSVSLLAANICLSSGPETRTHTTYTACKQHFCIFLCVWFLHSSFCLCRVVLLPSVCAMASDVSKSGALKQSWRASAFASLQEFLAKFASEIVQLQKKDLRSVANSSQSNKHAEWKQARNFFVRHFDFLPLEEKASKRRDAPVMHLDGIPFRGCPRTDTCWLSILEWQVGQLRRTDSQSAVAPTGQRCKVEAFSTAERCKYKQ